MEQAHGRERTKNKKKTKSDTGKVTKSRCIFQPPGCSACGNEYVHGITSWNNNEWLKHSNANRLLISLNAGESHKAAYPT